MLQLPFGDNTLCKENITFEILPSSYRPSPEVLQSSSRHFFPLTRPHGFLKPYTCTVIRDKDCSLRHWYLYRLKNMSLLHWPVMDNHWNIFPPIFPVPERKFSVVVAGNTNGTHTNFVSQMKRSNYVEVHSAQDSAFILVFCPIVSRVGTDIKEALQNVDRTYTPAPPSCLI